MIPPSAILTAEPVNADIHAGEWELTTQMKISGADYAMPPLSYKKCISSEDPDPTQIDPAKNCQLVRQQVKGHHYTWHRHCTDHRGITEILGEASYAGDTMRGTVHLKTGKLTIIRHIEGHRLGPCPEDSSRSKRIHP